MKSSETGTANKSSEKGQGKAGEVYVVRGICQIGAAAQIKQFVFKI